MRYIVEVANERGEKATKEYSATSSDDLKTKIAKDLRFYPDIHVADAWMKKWPSTRVLHGGW